MRIVGMMVVGTGEADRYLPRVLDRLDELCDEIVTACNATDKKTRKMLARRAAAYDFSDREWGKEQWKIKQELFDNCVSKENPDWIICVDSDEVLGEAFTREKAEEMTDRGEVAYEFYCVQLWGSEDRMRVDGLWGNFWNVRFFRYLPKVLPEYQRTALHCGLAPKYAYAWRTPGEHLFKHYGYMKEKDRKKKAERYDKYDPNAKYKSREYYESILKEGKVVPFNEEKFQKKLKYVPKVPKLERVGKKRIMGKMYYIKNKHGDVYRVREDQLEFHQRDDIEILGEDFVKPESQEVPKVEEEEDEGEFVCEICGKSYSSKGWLTRHTNKEHPDD